MLLFRRAMVVLVLVALVAVLPCHASAATTPAHRAEAEALARRAAIRLGKATLEWRRMAREDLERAVVLDPENVDIQILLARFYESASFWREARVRYVKVVRQAPGDAGGHLGLARSWRHDWLRYNESASLDSAIARLGLATRLDPALVRAWVLLASLRAERGDVRGAHDAAHGAVAAGPENAEALLALAALRWMSGDAEGADSTFAEALPRLPRRVRARFDDIAPVATAADTMLFNRLEGDARDEFARRFWVWLDPDLTTFENEARLEYWSRVARAYFLYWSPTRREWDDRGEMYVRFGPPSRTQTNPVMVKRPVLEHPLPDLLTWAYPQLGMGARLEDSNFLESYHLPRGQQGVFDPRVPEAVADAAGLMAVSGGRAVFPRTVPGVARVALAAEASRFQAERRPRVLASLEVRGGPADTLSAEYIVVDSTAHVVARVRSELSPSACEADAYRVADFASDLRPGRYVLGMSVAGEHRRGSMRMPLLLGANDSTLALSDVVITCGSPAAVAPEVRLAANPAGRVESGAPLTVYFEIYHLVPGADGHTRFEYSCAVRPRAPDRRIWVSRLLSPLAEPDIEMHRSEEHAGTLRRQFVSVPLKALPAGAYRVEVRIRDLVTGAEVSATAPFARQGEEVARAQVGATVPESRPTARTRSGAR